MPLQLRYLSSIAGRAQLHYHLPHAIMNILDHFIGGKKSHYDFGFFWALIE